MNHTVTPPTCTGKNCPPNDQLDELIHGRLSDSDSSDITSHLGECTGCQERMEALAVSGEVSLSQAVKHLDRADPPSESAYWRAVGQVQADLSGTGLFTPANGSQATIPLTDSVEALKLDFLAPSETAGRLGRISTFDVIRVVGRGGMGVVLHGFDDCLQRDVAVKILDPQLASNDTARQRFCREARAAAAVTHDNLVAVHQVDEDEKSGLPFLVMQLVNGESLEQRLKRVGKLAPAESARIGMQIAAGLAAAHANGLIHRDIKPGNILIEAGTEKVKLTDFGLARAAEDLKLTRTGFVAGTPLYMAPEQARGDDVDARADLFSLGSVMYEAIAGRPPFDGKTPLAVLRRVSDDAHEPLSKAHPDVPDWLEDVIDRLLEKDPADRIQSAAEVYEVLALHVAQPSLESSDSGCAISRSMAVSRRRRMEFCKKKVAAMVGLFLTGAVVGGYGTWILFPRVEDRPVLVNGSEPAAVVAPAPAGTNPIMELPPGNGAVWSVALSPDGTIVASGIESGRINLWAVNQSAPRLLGTLPDHRGPVWSVKFTPDGKRLVSASDDGTVKVWDVDTRSKLFSLDVGGSVRAASLSPSGNLIAVGDRFGDVRVFDLSQQKPIAQYHQDGGINAVAFSPDELTLASGGTDTTIVLWEIAGDRKRFTLTGHNGPVYGLSFSGDGQRLASAGWDNKVMLWNLNTGEKVRSISAHEDGVYAVQFSPCGGFLATGGQDGTAKLWDAERGEKLATFAGHRGTIHTVDYGCHGKVLATGGRDGTVKLWDVTPFLKCDPKK